MIRNNLISKNIKMAFRRGMVTWWAKQYSSKPTNGIIYRLNDLERKVAAQDKAIQRTYKIIGGILGATVGGVAAIFEIQKRKMDDIQSEIDILR